MPQPTVLVQLPLSSSAIPILGPAKCINDVDDDEDDGGGGGDAEVKK
jgi:hypothetical protein